jgi:beta-lactamase regulating signal transducer with metallopeptidase domain
MIEQLNTLSLTWWSWMSGMFWQVSLLIILISGIDLLLRRWVWPQVRYALWFMILLKLILPPTIASPVSITAGFQSVALKALGHYHTEQTSLAYDTTPVVTKTTPAESKSILTSEGKTIPSESESAIPKTKIKLNWQVFALFFWLFGSLSIFVFLIKKFKEMRKANGSGEKKVVPDWFELLLIQCARRLNLQVIPNIVITKKVNSPAIFGMIKPVLLLPTDFFGKTSKKDTENILLHELAHIKRRDLLIKELETFLTIIYWFNPLFWGVKKQLQHLRELCCDSTVVYVLQRKVKGYRSTLLQTARRLLAQPLEPGLGFLGLFEDSDRISTRLKWLDKDTFKFRWLRNTSVIFILIFVPLCILPMSKLEFQRTMEDIAEIEEDLSGEMDKIGKLLAELDLLKEKLNNSYKEIEEINGKEIDSLEKILSKREKDLSKKTEEHLKILKENEERLKEWKKNISKWEENYKKKNAEMIERYGKIDKEYLERIKEFQKRYSDKYKNKKWKEEELNKSIDSIFKNLDESSKEYFSNLYPIPKTSIKIDSLYFPPYPYVRIDTTGTQGLAIIEFGSDSASAFSIKVPKRILDSTSWPCYIEASEIDVDFHGQDSECKSDKHYFSREYDIKKGGKLEVYNINGKVEVSTWDKSKVKVFASLATKNTKYKDASQVIEIKTGSTMMIRTKNIKDISVAFEIKVPQGTKVEKITTSNGQIEASGIKGPTYLSSSNGMIVALNIDGDIIAETSNGKIDIGKAGFVKASTSNAAIYLRNIEGIEEIKTSNGKIYAEINRLKSDYTNIETSNGEIELRLSKKLDAELIANTSEGKIYTHEISGQQRFDIINSKKEKYIKAKVGKGGRKEINVRTSNGNISIKSLW